MSPMRRNRQANHADMLAQVTESLHIMQALNDSLERWPEVSAIAWEADSTEEFEARLRALLGLTEVQATAVADQQLRRVPREQRARIHARIDELKSELADLKSIDPA